MLLKVLFAQRLGEYEGEYAPEALAVVTEFDYDDYPDYLDREVQKALKNTEFINVRVIDIKVDEDVIKKLLVEQPKINGEIV